MHTQTHIYNILIIMEECKETVVMNTSVVLLSVLFSRVGLIISDDTYPLTHQVYTINMHSVFYMLLTPQ